MVYKKIKLCAKLVLSLSLVILFSANFQGKIYSKSKSSCTSNDLLDGLGFVESSKKEALLRLCNAAGIDVPKKLNANDVLKFVESTQKLFTNRKDKEERWEITALDWMKKDSTQKLEDIRTLGFVDKFKPKRKSYEAICVLGAVNDTMKIRMNYVEELVNSGVDTPLIILLSGERYVSAIDGPDCKLTKIAQDFEVDKCRLTEAHLLKNIFDNSFLSKKYERVLINTPRGSAPRPTTKTTVENLCKWANENQFSGKILFISNQPHVFYQEAVISEIIEQTEHNFDFEVVGPNTESQDVQQLVGAVGSYIWASIPQVMSKMGIYFKNSEDIELAKKLYGNQSWISNLTV